MNDVAKLIERARIFLDEQYADDKSGLPSFPHGVMAAFAQSELTAANAAIERKDAALRKLNAELFGLVGLNHPIRTIISSALSPSPATAASVDVNAQGS